MKTLSILPRLFGIVLATGFGLWSWMAWDIKQSGFGSETEWFGPAFFGLLALGSALIGVITLVMKLRAPVPRAERAPEGSETLTFDADAAIERYLAQKRSTTEPFPVETVPHASRQVFGRKNADPA